MKILSRRWWLTAIGALAVAGVAVPASGAFARSATTTTPARAGSQRPPRCFAYLLLAAAAARVLGRLSEKMAERQGGGPLPARGGQPRSA